MKNRPILFSAPMVRALLDDRKTQTRRLVKGQALDWLAPEMFSPEYVASPGNGLCPYGFAGDRLWVRETFVIESNHGIDSEASYPPPHKDGRPIKRTASDDEGHYWEQCHYRATDPTPELDMGEDGPACKWTPSIHMPRWASRILLDITGIRVERLNDISERDCCAEGCGSPITRDCKKPKYKALWEQINGAGSWDKNPWVWVVEFKRLAPQGAEQQK